MALRPYSATLQAAYRDTLGTPGAPEVIDDSTPVMPVAVVAQVNTAATSSYMRITDGTDNLEITSTGGITAEPTNKTTVLLSGTRSTSGTTTLGTVPASKVWRIVSANLSTGLPGAASKVQLQFNGVDALTIDLTFQTTTLGGGTANQSWDYSCCPTITAGQTVTLVNSLNVASTASIVYVEVAA